MKISLRFPVFVLLLVATLVNAAFSGFGSREFESQLDRLTNSVATGSNCVGLLREGAETYPERLRLIEEATDHIYIQTFILEGGDIGRTVLEALKTKIAQGVDVKIIYDTFGSILSDPDFFIDIREAGIELRKHNTTPCEYPGIGHLWHEKTLIIDGKRAVTGGMNITDVNVEGALPFNAPHPRDTDTVLSGPSVYELGSSFVGNWNLLGGNPELSLKDNTLSMSNFGDTHVRVVVQKPEQGGVQNINNLYLACINTAVDSIRIESPYFSPQEEIRSALIAAARRGVSVTLLVNSYKTLDFKWRYIIARSYYDDLLTNGIAIYEIQTRMLHSKIAVFDGVYSIVGTYNLDRRSYAIDSEGVVSIDSPEFATKVCEWFERGLTEARLVNTDWKFPIKNILN